MPSLTGLTSMRILRTPDNKDFVNRIYSAIDIITDRAYQDASDTIQGQELKRNIELYKEQRSRQNGYDRDVDVKIFRNKEIGVEVLENVRKKDVYLISFPLGYDGETYDPNIGYMKLFVTNNALKGSSVGKIINVLPEHPYDRQDRKSKPREPISAKMIAGLIQSSAGQKLERVMTIDIHAPQIQGFYDVPVDNLTPMGIFAYHLNNLHLDKNHLCLVSPDAGGVDRTEKLLKPLGLTPNELVVIIKQRPKPGEAGVRYVNGVVRPLPIIVDDKIDSGGTQEKGSRALRKKAIEQGIKIEKTYTCATHAILTDHAEEKLGNEGIRVITTNSIPRNPEYVSKFSDLITFLPIEYLLADAIFRTQTGQSTRPLFDHEYVSELYRMFEPKRDLATISK